MVLPLTTTTSTDVRTNGGSTRPTQADFGSRRRTTPSAAAAARMQAALSSFGKLNAYELLPGTSQEASLLPGQGTGLRKRPVASKRRLVALVLLLPTLALLAFGLGGLSLTSQSRTSPPATVELVIAQASPASLTTMGYPLLAPSNVAAAPEPAVTTQAADFVATEPALPTSEAARWSCDHPRFRLPPIPPVPPNNPVSYPAPPPACLLHLFTLSKPADFSPALCDLTDTLEPVDATVLFVNGTGDLFLSAYDAALTAVNEDGGAVQPARRHYSNMGELRFALRSIARNLLGGRLEAGSIRGLGSDYQSVEDDTMRLGQIPHWLDWNLVDRPWADAQPDDRRCAFDEQASDGTTHAAGIEASPGRRSLTWSFHSEVFLGDATWKAEALPTFNSFAIESQLANLPDLSPTFVSMNDDFMILKPLSSADFHTALFGPVFRLQDDLKVIGKASATVGDSGEWGGLEWAAWILNHRHPNTGLEYLNHLPKTLTQAHLHELSITFKDALREASLRRFREQKTHGPDIELAFLATHYIRQRYREALLFSFVVARPATAAGSTWGLREKEELRALGIDGWRGKVGERGHEWSSAAVQQVVSASGDVTPLATEYRYTSASGLPRNPFYAGAGAKLDLALCLGPWWTADNDDAEVDSAALFVRLAFENLLSQCGGLLITAILDKSTDSGLAAILPRPGTVFRPVPTAGSPVMARPHIYNVPHLPLTPTWKEANFTLAALLPAWNGMPQAGVDLVEWTVTLLGRYRHTLGSTPSHFTSLRGTSSLLQLDRYLDGNPDVALLALNDDIPASYPEHMRAEVVDQLRGWGDRRWPGREAWETEEP